MEKLKNLYIARGLSFLSCCTWSLNIVVNRLQSILLLLLLLLLLSFNICLAMGWKDVFLVENKTLVADIYGGNIHPCCFKYNWFLSLTSFLPPRPFSFLSVNLSIFHIRSSDIFLSLSVVNPGNCLFLFQ